MNAPDRHEHQVIFQQEDQEEIGGGGSRRDESRSVCSFSHILACIAGAKTEEVKTSLLYGRGAEIRSGSQVLMRYQYVQPNLHSSPVVLLNFIYRLEKKGKKSPQTSAPGSSFLSPEYKLR